MAPRLSGQLHFTVGVRINEIVRITKIKMAAVQKVAYRPLNSHDLVVCHTILAYNDPNDNKRELRTLSAIRIRNKTLKAAAKVRGQI